MPLLVHLEGKSQAPADLTAEYLNLAPSQHTEETLKATLGSCQNVVNRLGTLRNKIGDAHGQGRKPIRPSRRHAALAVILAEAIATFYFKRACKRAHNLAESLSVWINSLCASFAFPVLCKQ